MWLKQMPLGILRATTNTKATGPVVAEAAVEADAIGGAVEEKKEEVQDTDNQQFAQSVADRVDNIMTAHNNNNNNGQGRAQGGNVGGGPPAVVNLAQAPPDNQNPPIFGNDSISGSTGAPSGQNYYGPPQAFNNGRYQPAPFNNHQHGTLIPIIIMAVDTETPMVE